MKNRRNWVLLITEVIIALPVIAFLGFLTVNLVQTFGLVVIPAGLAVYLLISLVVDKFFSRQSLELEQALARKLTFGTGKSAGVPKEG